MWRVQATLKSGKARTGLFLNKLATPAPLLYTKRGQVPHISPDMLAKLTPVKAMLLQTADL